MLQSGRRLKSEAIITVIIIIIIIIAIIVIVIIIVIINKALTFHCHNLCSCP